MQKHFLPHGNAEQTAEAMALELSRLRLQLRHTRLRLLEADHERAALRNSNSWWITAPLRRFMRRHPGPALLARRALRLLVWAGTGELTGRLRARRVAAAAQAQELQAPSFPQDGPAPAMLPLPAPSGPQGRTILVVDQGVPLPDHFAGARTLLGILSLLRAEGWSVTFWPFDRADAGPYARSLEALGISVVDHRFGGDLEEWLAAHGPRLDHVMLMRPRIAGTLLPAVLRHSDARLSYYGHDMHYARFRQEAELSGNRDMLEIAARMEAAERRVWRAVDVVLYPSPEEAAEVQRLEPGVDARALPPYAFDSFPPPRLPTTGETMLFVGGFRHPPNVDAACWFVQSVLPRILAQRPHARFVVAGSSPPAAVHALAGPQVVVTGQISDAELADWYASARVAVAPLRFGAGVKGKVVEALHAGLPLVTTTVGAQGLPGLAAIAPVHDDADAQADAVLRMLAGDAAWQAQAAAQVAYAERHFSRETMRASLLAALAGEPPLAGEVAT
jgi:glycosyltransferase involved in cell wall biosynthesis